MNFRTAYLIVTLACLILLLSSTVKAAIIWEDTFNRPDSSTVGGSWTDASTWEIKSQTLYHNNAAGDEVTTTSATGGWNAFKLNSTSITGVVLYSRNAAVDKIIEILWSSATQMQYNSGSGNVNCGGTSHTYAIDDYILVNKTTSPYEVWLYSGGVYSNLCNVTTSRNFAVGAGYVQVHADASLGVRAIGHVCSSDLKEDCISAPTSGPIVSFTNSTPNSGTYQYDGNNTFLINTTSSGLGGTVTTNQTLYNSTGSVVQSTSNTSQNVSNTFTLPYYGVFYFNATASNTTAFNKTETRTITYYVLNPGGINTPANNSQQGGVINVSWNSTTSNPLGLSATYNATLLNSSGGLVAVLRATPSASTSLVFDSNYLNLSLGLYDVRVYSNDTYANSAYTQNRFNLTTNMLVRISSYYSKNGTGIQNFNVSITDFNTSQTTSTGTTNGSVYLDSIRGDYIQITYTAAGIAIQSFNYTLINNATQIINQSLAANNSVYVYLYDENTNAAILENISIQITGVNYSQTTSAANGTYYIDGLPAQAYTFQFAGTNYTVKSYVVTVSESSTQTLNAYLSRSSSTVIFTVNNYNTGDLLEGASFVVERMFNGTYTVVDNRLTDITGRVQTTYTPNTLYRFTVSLSNFSSKVFTLNPIIFSSYTVSLIPSSSQNNNLDYSDVGVVYYPKTVPANENTNVTFVITSPLGKLEDYQVNASWRGGSYSGSGVNAYGATFVITVNITAAQFGDRVNLTYTYDPTTGTPKTFAYTLEITGIVGGNQTYSALKERDYGLGKFEKIILVMPVVIIGAGLAFALGGVPAALTVGLLIEGIAVYMGFMDLWAFLITALVGVVVVFRYGGEG